MAVVELAKFKLRSGISEQDFLAAERRIRSGQIQHQAGYQGREIGRGDNGEWYVIIRWDSKINAEAWTPKFMQDPDGQAFAALLDFSTMRQERLEVVTL